LKYTALRLIREEHRSLAAVIRAAEHVVEKAASTGKRPDFKLLRAILYYLREFPERRHHPNEDRLLFRRIKSRTHDADAVIAELEDEHQRGEMLLQRLATALGNWEADTAEGRKEFADALSIFSTFYWAHMDKEERRVLPVAERALTSEDWHEIQTGFESHQDPMFGEDTADEFRRLFSRIMRLAPSESDQAGESTTR
jgi:hemerythrin-like domain-containing protein